MSKNNVNHPQHYKGTSLECIECMEVIFGKKNVCMFCLCNAFKYMWRYKNKNGVEDINKAKWYLDYVKKYIDKQKYIGVQDTVYYDRLRVLLDNIIASNQNEEE